MRFSSEQAVQFTGQDIPGVLHWTTDTKMAGMGFGKVVTSLLRPVVLTPSGPVMLVTGDWVITNPDGTLSVRSGEEFDSADQVAQLRDLLTPGNSRQPTGCIIPRLQGY